MALCSPQRQRNHVARHQISGANAQIKAFGHNIDQPPFSHQIDPHFGIAAQEIQHQRRRGPSALHRGIDPQHARRRLAL
jgi:hypothetical protein